MPCYNAEEYLNDTIQCLLTQDYKNIELIIVDDGSIDDSYSIAKAYECDKVIVLRQANRGACVARNLAFEKSSGDYIMYMDADDLITRDQIASQMSIQNTIPDGFITFGRWARFYDTLSSAIVETGEIYHDYNFAADALADIWNGKGMMPIHSYIIPRSVIGNQRFNSSLRVNQDGEFLCRILMRAKGLKYCPNGIAYYRSGIIDSISAKKISHEKGLSLFLSTQLCVQTCGNLSHKDYYAQGLAKQFYNVAYIYSKYPDIVELAHNEIKKLSINTKHPKIGGKNFQLLCILTNFWIALKIKNKINKE